MISYIFLAGSIICVVNGTLLLPYSKNFTKVTSSVFLVLFYFLAFAVKEIPLTIVYVTWCGAGILLVSVTSYFLFGHNLSWQGKLGVVLIVVGVTLVNDFKSSSA